MLNKFEWCVVIGLLSTIVIAGILSINNHQCRHNEVNRNNFSTSDTIKTHKKKENSEDKHQEDESGTNGTEIILLF